MYELIVQAIGCTVEDDEILGAVRSVSDEELKISTSVKAYRSTHRE
jgi:hypothetical protein